MNFIEKYKKILFLIGFILITVILGYLIYRLFFVPAFNLNDTNVEQTASSTPQNGFPGAGEGGQQIVETPTSTPITGTSNKLAEEQTEQKANPYATGGLTETTDLNKTPSISPTLSADGTDVQYYDKGDGKFYRIDANGEATAMSEKVFYNVENVTWSKGKNKAILEYPDGANIVYNFDTNKQITLPSHWKDFDFSPTTDKIVMKSMGMDEENRWLAVANDDGSNVKAIEALGDKDDTVYPSWSPNNQMVGMYTEGIDFNRQEVYFVGLNEENFKSTVIEGRGFQPKWAPTGEKLVYSVYSSDNEMKPKLWVVDANGDNIGNNRKDLYLETWAEKCTFANANEMYCAVPQSLEKGAGIFPELAKNSIDQLYKVDVRTGIKKLVATTEQDFNMSNLTVTKDGKNLYFTDSNTQTLHKIKLK